MKNPLKHKLAKAKNTGKVLRLIIMKWFVITPTYAKLLQVQNIQMCLTMLAKASMQHLEIQSRSPIKDCDYVRLGVLRLCCDSIGQS